MRYDLPKEGYYRMMRPIKSKRGPFYLIGGIVGGKKTPSYSKRVADVKEVVKAFELVRMQIEKDHPGIKPENESFMSRIH